MSVEITALKWSDTGKRVDFRVSFREGDGIFIPRKQGEFKAFALGSEDALSDFSGNEHRLASEIVDSRSTWLKNPGKRYYTHTLDSLGITVRVWKNSYDEQG